MRNVLLFAGLAGMLCGCLNNKLQDGVGAVIGEEPSSVGLRTEVDGSGKTVSLVSATSESGTEIAFVGSQVISKDEIRIAEGTRGTFIDQAEKAGYYVTLPNATKVLSVVHASINSKGEPINYKDAGIIVTIPAKALPAQAIPSNALPAQAIPSNALPAQAIPSNALPSGAISHIVFPGPSSAKKALESSALPAQAIPSNALPAQLVKGDALPAQATGGGGLFSLLPDISSMLKFQTPVTTAPSDPIVSAVLLGTVDDVFKIRLLCQIGDMGSYQSKGLPVSCKINGNVRILSYNLIVFSTTRGDYESMRLNEEPVILFPRAYDVAAPQNRAPTILNESNVVIGADRKLKIGASDPDGDFLLAFVDREHSTIPSDAYQSYDYVVFPEGFTGSAALSLIVIDNGNPKLSAKKTITVTFDANAAPQTPANPDNSQPLPAGDPQHPGPDGGPDVNPTTPDPNGGPVTLPPVSQSQNYDPDWAAIDEYGVVGAFSMQRTEVSTEAFAVFLNQHGNDCAGFACADLTAKDALIVDNGAGVYEFNAQDADLPATFVTWHGAAAYCKSLGGDASLPSQAQWSRAAYAGIATTYPWGNDLADEANCAEAACADGETGLAPVGSFGAGSPFGISDLIGNVAEWSTDSMQVNCSTDPSSDAPFSCPDQAANPEDLETDPASLFLAALQPTTEAKMILGASHLDGVEADALVLDALALPTTTAAHIGFRCVKPLETPLPQGSRCAALDPSIEADCRADCTTLGTSRAAAVRPYSASYYNTAATGYGDCGLGLWCCAGSQAKADGGWCETPGGCK